MITAYLINFSGRYVSKLIGSWEVININTPSGYRTTLIAPNEFTDYWDGNRWVDIGYRPNNYCIFNYEEKNWQDLRTLEQAKLDKWNELKQQRDALEFGGFEFNGHVFDSDLESQARINSVANIGEAVKWTLASNEVIELFAEDLLLLRKELAKHVAELHESARQLRLRIEESSSIDEIASINFD